MKIFVNRSCEMKAPHAAWRHRSEKQEEKEGQEDIEEIQRYCPGFQKRVM